MKKSIRMVSAVAATLTALVTATSANAYISTGDETSYIINRTNGCVRAYVGNQQIDVGPHSVSHNFDVTAGQHYLVSVFPTAFCGNAALHSNWYYGGYVWTVNP